MILLLLRAYYPQMLHFISLCLSLLAFRYRVPRSFWKLLRMFGIIYGYKATGLIATTIGQRSTPSSPEDVPAGSVAGIYTFDNNEIFRRTNAQHAEEGRRNDMLCMNCVYLYKDSYATQAQVPLRGGKRAALCCIARAGTASAEPVLMHR